MVEIDDSVRVRIIRLLLGIKSKELAARLGITAGALSSWETGRHCPQREKRKLLADICQKEGICFMPSGYPVPMSDLMPVKQENEQ